jgi:hypothetical protein
MADIPSSTIEPIDPGLGVSEAANMRFVVLGLASAGAVDEINWYSSASALVAEYVSGPGVEDACQLLAYAGGPVGFVRVTGSVTATNSAIVKSGAGPTVTVAGTPLIDAGVQIRVMDGGILGAGTFQYTLDYNSALTTAEMTWSGKIVIPSGGTYAIPGLGDTLTFPAGTYVADETYTFTASCAGFASANVLTAMDVALAGASDFRVLLLSASVLCGGHATMTGILAAAQSQLEEIEGDARYKAMIAPTSAVLADAASAVKTTYATVEANRQLIAHGFGRYVAQVRMQGRGYVDRPVALSFAVRAAQSLPSTDLKRVKSGKLPGLVKLYFDERVEASLMDDVKVSTLRTYVRRPGFFITQGRIKSAPGSDFTMWPRRLIHDIASETAQAAGVEFIGRGVRAKTDGTGTIDERDALALEAEAQAKLEAQLVQPRNAEGSGGYVSAVRYTIDRTTNIVTSETLYADVAILPLATLTWITTRVGYSLNAGATTEETAA